MSPSSLRLVRGCAFLGLAASMVSLYTHQQLLLNPSYVSFCDVNATISCAHAYTSPYGSLYGVPVALLGVLWFGFFSVISLLGTARPGEGAPPSALLFALSLLPLPAIVYLAYAAFVILKAVCLMCLTTYLAVIASVLVLAWSAARPLATLSGRVAGDARALASRPLAWVMVAFFAVIGVAGATAFPRAAAERPAPQAAVAPPMTPDQRAAWENLYAMLPRVPIPVPPGRASVVIVKFTDLQCPACAWTHVQYKPVIEKYQAKYPGAVVLVTKDYPLQPDCNSSVKRTVHTASCDAAAALRMAAPEKRLALESWFYLNQLQMSPATVRDVAGRVGGVKDFDKGYAAAIAAIQPDIALATKLGINSTPTFYVNGARLPTSPMLPSPEQLDIAIAYELKKAGK